MHDHQAKWAFEQPLTDQDHFFRARTKQTSNLVFSSAQ